MGEGATPTLARSCETLSFSHLLALAAPSLAACRVGVLVIASTSGCVAATWPPIWSADPLRRRHSKCACSMLARALPRWSTSTNTSSVSHPSNCQCQYTGMNFIHAVYQLQNGPSFTFRHPTSGLPALIHGGFIISQIRHRRRLLPVDRILIIVIIIIGCCMLCSTIRGLQCPLRV